MSGEYDIEMSLNDTLELDTIIEKSTRASNSLTYDSSKFNKSDIQTHTSVLNPTEPGTYTVTVNGQELSIKVRNPEKNTRYRNLGQFRYLDNYL